jgi:hypothetical protein
MADKKIEKALYGPSTTEVALGAILGLAAGLLVACVYLVFKPVQQVKEMPKEKDVVRGAVYYLPGSDSGTKGKGYVAKQKTLISGTGIELTEDELNAWSAATFTGGTGGKAAPKPATPGKDGGGDAGAGYDGIFNPGVPNFKFVRGNLQIGTKCVLNWYGLTKEITVYTVGSFARSGDDVVFVPQELFLGSCPVHMIPKLADPLMGHLLGRKKVPDEIKSAWAKVSNATVEASTLKLTME